MTSQRRLHGMSRPAVAAATVVLGLAATASAAPQPDERSTRPARASPPAEQWDTRADQIVAAREGYRIALRRLVPGSPGHAIDSLIAFEERFVEEGSGLPARTLERGEKEVLSWLAAQDPEAILPILLLHVDTFRRHQQQGRQPFADHHAAMAVRAAGHLAAAARTASQRCAAADPLAAIGLALLEERRRTAAHGILLAAREIDPANANAVLGLATDREWQGDAEEVVTLLGAEDPRGDGPGERRRGLSDRRRRRRRAGVP